MNHVGFIEYMSVLLFKGKGNIGVDQRQQYSKCVHVIFTSKSVLNGPSMDPYVKT
jgi:hypothetical protein